MSGNSNKKIAFNYFGGKFTWLDNLYQNSRTWSICSPARWSSQ